MNLVMWTSSRLQTAGGPFSENDQLPVIWSAASFRFYVKVVLRWPLYTSVVSYCSLVIQTDVRRVGNSFYLVPSFAAFLSLFNHLCVPVSCGYFSSNNQSNANCQKHWFNAVTFGGNKLSLFKKKENVYICPIYIPFNTPLRCPTSCKLHETGGVLHCFRLQNPSVQCLNKSPMHS